MLIRLVMLYLLLECIQIRQSVFRIIVYQFNNTNIVSIVQELSVLDIHIVILKFKILDRNIINMSYSNYK